MDPQTSTCNASEPYVEILIQPAFSNYFRYTCETENKCRGRIVGVNSTAQMKQYPTIQVYNYTGEFTLIASCVTCDGPPHRPHPHKLCGSHCSDGIFSRKVAASSYSFTDLTIQCMRRNQIDESLRLRRNYNIDPYQTGFENTTDFDLNSVRLCFQVFITSDNQVRPLVPVVSQPIRNKRKVSDLNIARLSHYSAPVDGGTEIIILCNLITEDMQLWFYEEESGEVIWECESRFSSNDVFKNVALSCRVPRYHDINIRSYRDIFIQFRDGNRIGTPRCFRYLPINKDSSVVRRKKFRIGATDFSNTEAIAVPRMIRKPSKTNEKTITEQTAIDTLRSSFDPCSSTSSTTLCTSAATENNGTISQPMWPNETIITGKISHPMRSNETRITEHNFVEALRRAFGSCSAVSFTTATIGNNEQTGIDVLRTTLDPCSSISLTAVHHIAAEEDHEMDFDRSLSIFNTSCSSASSAHLDAELTSRWRENPCEVTLETSQLAVPSDDTLHDTFGGMNNSMEQLSISDSEDIFGTYSECVNLPINLSETIFDSS